MAGGVHIAVLLEHVVDVLVLPVDAPANDVAAACAGHDELAQLFLPLACRRGNQMSRRGAFSGRSRSDGGSICQRRAMRSSSASPSERGWTAYPAVETCHPWGRCHDGGARMPFSYSTLASSALKFVGWEKPPPPLSSAWWLCTIVWRARRGGRRGTLRG
jgi:hypothetical protein